MMANSLPLILWMWKNILQVAVVPFVKLVPLILSFRLMWNVLNFFCPNALRYHGRKFWQGVYLFDVISVESEVESQKMMLFVKIFVDTIS